MAVAAVFTKGRPNNNMKNFGKVISGALLTLAFVFGISAATSLTAQAQYRNDDGQYNRQQDRDDDRDQNGQYRQRRRRNRDNNQAQNEAWRRQQERNRGNSQRDRRYGTNGDYNNGSYNNGGYNNGRNNNGGYNNAVVQQGYQAGINTGASDAQRNQNYNAQRSHYYRDANSQAFRQAFLQGYDQGYRQYGGNRNQRNRTNTNGGFGNILGGIFRP
jgi:hypothetical protein